MVRTPDGYVIRACRLQLLARDQAGIIRRLAAIARRKR
jgi:hypothetical protein